MLGAPYAGLVTRGQVAPTPMWRPQGNMTGSRLLSPVPCCPQAWRAVDRAYVDKSFNGQSWFRVGGDANAGQE